MKTPNRRKDIEVTYKGWKLVQHPWNSFEGKQYAKWLFDETGEERLHAGYSSYCTRKQLRLMIRRDVDILMPMLDKKYNKLGENNEKTYSKTT